MNKRVYIAVVVAMLGLAGCTKTTHSSIGSTGSPTTGYSYSSDTTDPGSSDTTDPGSSDTTDPASASTGGSSDSGGQGSTTYSGTGKNLSQMIFTYDGQQITGLHGAAGFFCYPSGYGIQEFDELDHATPVNNGQFDDSFEVTIDDGSKIDFTLKGTVDGNTVAGNLSVKRAYCTTESDFTAQPS
jgi:hypothetical protein